MNDGPFMRLALGLARRASGQTSPNPMVGAVLVRGGEVVGRGYHHRAGQPHAEIEALRDATRHGHATRGATLYVTLEPCSTHGRTPPCTEALIAAGLKTVVVAATDPNPAHAGRGFRILRQAGLEVRTGILADAAIDLNEAFNHWIVQRTPFVTVKAAMTLDGKIATAAGDSKWITGERARAYGMKLRWGADAILVGVNTILADDPSLTLRPLGRRQTKTKPWRRLVLDSRARTPQTARVVADAHAAQTTLVVASTAPRSRVAALARRVEVWLAPTVAGQIDLGWLLKELGQRNTTSLLVEGGGEVNASFLLGGWAQRVAFFYAPKILGGQAARKSVAGEGIRSLDEKIPLRDLTWKKLGPDLLLSARLAPAIPAR